MKPIIGIVEWPYKDKDGDYIYEVFKGIIDKVNKCGGIPVGLFPSQSIDYYNSKICDIPNLSIDELKDMRKSLSICDAIIKPGALRIYGYERYIYNYALEKDIPYLGICAGMQLMANTENIKNDTNHFQDHYIKILENTLLSEIIGEKEILVNSRHNYHIKNSGENSVCALSNDGIIEAIYNKNKKFHLGVQWHPELLECENSYKIFRKLIKNAEKSKK
ncbi:MAG: gamma-glutamyl-gamma-aminobutyrate hydrolase family protein [Bacilli bacterium]|jgi:putative glutamine amidotransferase|nr:gamma-glutamyl-gamma-aminobutyrate hydrolase family protein [Bacilli bacterium]